MGCETGCGTFQLGGGAGLQVKVACPQWRQGDVGIDHF